MKVQRMPTRDMPAVRTPTAVSSASAASTETLARQQGWSLQKWPATDDHSAEGNTAKRKDRHANVAEKIYIPAMHMRICVHACVYDNDENVLTRNSLWLSVQRLSIDTVFSRTSPTLTQLTWLCRDRSTLCCDRRDTSRTGFGSCRWFWSYLLALPANTV
jgi:hypothetical protein